MIGTSLSHYKITGQLGVGGMGEVYRASDSRLGRDVAIKLLPAAFDRDPERIARFEREARLLAALNHPHIASIHGFEEYEGKHFLVLELIEGETLGERLLRGRLSVRGALEVGQQLAEALEAAHEKGIIHRDLKPANIKFTGNDTVKVLDFGLAKALTQASATDETVKVDRTMDGVLMGTPAYMSPEQANGREVDEQSDIWSFGCILFECLTGQRLFGGRTVTESLSAVLQKEPAWELVPKEAPAIVEQVLRKCLDRNRRRRLRAIGNVVVDLETALGDMRTGRARMRRRGPAIAKAGMLTLLGGLLLGGLVWWLGPPRGGTRPTRTAGQPISTNHQRLAVLPLMTIGSSTNDEFAVGLTEELLTRLAKIGGLRAISGATFMRNRGAGMDVPDIGRELKVGSVLQGSVQQSENRLRIRLRLVDVQTQESLWSDDFDREFKDVFKIQSEVAQSVAGALRVTMLPGERQQIEKKPTESIEAYQLFLRGRFHWNQYTLSGFRTSIGFYQEAIEKDPNFALAYSGLADSCVQLGIDWLPPAEQFRRAKTNALQALKLDDNLAEAWVSLGTIQLFHEWAWPEAEISFKRALQCNAGYADAYHFYGHYLEIIGKPRDAVALMKQGLERDPHSAVIPMEIGGALYHARQYDEAIAQCEEALKVDPAVHLPYVYMAQAWNQKGKTTQAIETIKRAMRRSSQPQLSAELAYFLAKAGQAEEARLQLEALRVLGAGAGYEDPFLPIAAYAALGETNRALSLLERACAERSVLLSWIQVEPELDALRHEPRFIDVVRRMNLAK